LRDRIFQLLNAGKIVVTQLTKMWSHRPYIWLTEIFESVTKGCTP